MPRLAPRPPARLPRQLILPCLLLVLAGCGGATPPELVEIPHPLIEQVEDEPRQQLEVARKRLEGLQAGDGAEAEIAAAAGELGRLYQGYDFDEAAIAAYSNASALTPGNFRWLYYLGALELDSGRIESGRSHLEEALESRPGDAPALLRLGRAALDEAEFADAIELYQQAADADPGCAAAYFGLGLAALGQNAHEAAVKAFQQALDLDPGASQTYRPMAMAYRALDQTERAKESLARAGTAVPTCPDPLIAEIQELVVGASALFERATLADLEGRSRAALGLAQQAVESGPEHAAARRLYGQLLTRAGEISAAVEQLEAAVEIEPEDRRTFLLLGRAHRAGGALDESVRALQRAVALDPRYARASIELALSQMERGYWGQARAALEAGLAESPEDLDLRVQLARTMAAMGDLRQSRTELESIVEQAPGLSTAHVALGTMLLDAERPDEAERHLEAALEGEATSETYALAHYQLARLAAGREDTEMARSHLETAIDLSPNFIPAKLALGEVELTQGRTTQATRLYADAATLRPDLPQPRAGEALALLHSGRHLDARRKLESANREFPRDPEIAHLLARVLATAPAPRVRDGQKALQLSSGLFSGQKSLEYGETVAMALAELERYDEAAEWQQRLLDQARESDVELEILEQLEARLDDYQRGRPIREAW